MNQHIIVTTNALTKTLFGDAQLILSRRKLYISIFCPSQAARNSDSSISLPPSSLIYHPSTGA